MAKKHWIYIKRGLSEDPKHRAAMGECIWLYMHIIDRADWDTGVAYEWKDKEEAADMGMPFETLRDQRQKLERLDYIRCSKKQHGQDIRIMEWKNPRDYSSDVKNPRIQGDAVPPLSDFQSDPQSDPQSDGQVSSQPVTPSLYSKSKSIPDVNAILFRGDFHEYPEHLWNIAESIRDTWMFALPSKGKGKKAKNDFTFWTMSMEDLKQACGEFGADVLKELRCEFMDYMSTHQGVAPYTVAGPQSLVNVARGKAALMRTPKKTDEQRPEYKPVEQPKGNYVPNPSPLRPADILRKAANDLLGSVGAGESVTES